jgi:DeoR family transcriptional regulator, fructose operon transcriptional repressor
MSTATPKELSEVRLQKIATLLKDKDVLRVEELIALLAVSPATVRRDLAELEKRGEVRRIHGGVLAATVKDDEPLFDDKATLAAEEKQRIAEKALELIRPRTIVYLDGGSTVLALARLLTGQNNITVVTNSLRVAQVLSNSGPKMILTGGECRLLSQTMVGPLTRAILDQVRIDIAFIGTLGASLEHGLTTTDPAEAFTKEYVMSRAARTILLTDSTKFGKTSFVRFGTLNQVSTIITDNQLSQNDRKAVKRAGVELILT